LKSEPTAVDPLVRELLHDLSLLAAEEADLAPIEERASARLADLVAQPSRLRDAGEDLVGALCRLAVDARSERRPIGQRLLFTGLAERLADSFDPEQGPLYDELFSRVIDFCRRRPQGRSIDDRLRRFRIDGREALLVRKARLRQPGRLAPSQLQAVRRCFVLSRVTLGAEVAVTSLALQKAGRIFPRAERVLFAPGAARVLFPDTDSFRLVEQPYRRHGGLEDRLASWIDLVAALDRERSGLRPEECVVIDPDSRVTQLGLLPVVEEDVPYLFFESRGYRRPGLHTLGALTARWLEEVLGPDEQGPLYPRVEVPDHDRAWARETMTRLRAGQAGPVTAVNFGVGDNPRKRIEGAFELDLVRSLLGRGGVLVLDKGVGEEIGRAEAVLSALQREGRPVIELSRDRLPSPSAGRALFAYQGGVGPFAALLAVSDVYLGYDSAFQHIAAAQGVPVIDIFVDPPSTVFAQRWTPHVEGGLRVVRARGGTRDATADVLKAYEELRSAVGRARP
jgi:hypothetical protein